MIVTQPTSLKTQLYQHQLAIIYRMEMLENQKSVEHKGQIKQTRLGVNSDPTGTGKTFSMIALIIRDKMGWDMDIPYISENISYEAGGFVKNIIVKRYTKLLPTLILVSPSILLQWEEELTQSDLNVEIVTTKRDVDTVVPNNHDVILVTTKMYNSLISSHSNHIWKRFIFDEPGHTRVTGMRDIQAGFTWLVTSTPNDISTYHYNCKGMMKSIIGDSYMDFNTQFGCLIIKNDQESIEASVQLPTTKHHTYTCFQPIVNVVDGLVSKHIKTLIEAGNIYEAIISMGGTTTNNIVELIHNKKQQELDNIEDDDDKKDHINTQIKELDQRFSHMLQSPCNICMEPLDNPVLEPNCHNIFCGKCLLNWLHTKSNCPMCRNDIQLENLIHVDNSSSTKHENEPIVKRPHTKTEEIISIINSKIDGKFIIFSVYDESFGPICKILQDNDITFVNISGPATKRHTNIKKFKGGKCKVIFLNSSFNSAGINLPETTDIILYHDMSKTTHDQIIGRAQRIGRTEPLYIHHLT